METKKKVAAYCRVSTDKDDQVNSLNSQIEYFTRYINNNEEWKLVEVYYDEGITGTSTKKRKDFNRMIADASNGKINLILTKEISRFARNTLDSIKYTRELKEKGVGVFFINDNINTLDGDSELRLAIMSSIAQEESRKTSERVKWGQKRRMEQGVVFGRDMLGYYVREGEMIINEDEAHIITQIYHKFLREGKGTRVIARELYEAGIKPKRVKEWSATIILKILRNEKYVGDLLQKKTYTPNYLNHSKKYNKGHEEKVYLKDHHEPIIDRETWDATQEELKRRTPSDERKSKYSNRYWCSGKIFCGECGQRFVSRRKTLSDGSMYKAWRCHAAAEYGKIKIDVAGNQVGCNSGSINDKTLLYCADYIFHYLQMNKDEIIKELMHEIKSIEAKSSTINVSKLYEQINQINNKKAKVYDLYIDGLMSKEDLKMQIEQYDNQVHVITNQITTAENANNIRLTQTENVNIFMFKLQKFLKLEAGKEPLYRELIDKIVVYNNNMIEIFVVCLPYGIRLKYTTSGRTKNYKVDIEMIN
jgi:DNA invertase Pin-like site-specific DNA recombinase